MAKTLVIVESPAKAKTISKFLGKGYKVEATMGHIKDLPKSQLGINIEKNFEPKYITIRGKGPILEKIKKEVKKADKILLATDPDREGEAISWHLAKQFHMKGNEKCRIEFHEITKNAVKNSLENIREIDKNLVDAQQARRILDRLVGYKISPLLWKKIRKGLSAGRVQSVATRIIVDREKEIQNFIPEEYWTIIAYFYKKDSITSFEAKFYGEKNKKLALKNKKEVQEIIQYLKKQEYIVDKIKKGTKKRNSPLPFTTSSLQQEASRKLNFTAKKTMNIAQQLYEGIQIKDEGHIGLITYIRTDSTRISKEAREECNKFIQKEYGKEYVGEDRKAKGKNNKIQDAHEAIRPSSVYRLPNSIKESLSRDQFKLYKLIWERFVASQMGPALYNTISIDIIAGKYVFRSSGSQLAFQGFMKIYVEGSDEEKEEKDILFPSIEEGEKLYVKKLLENQHFTSPPSRFTEATLVKTLEELGIGRPSTYAPTISTILSRGYVQKDKKYFIPTQLGELVTDLMKKYFTDIVDVDFTVDLEKKLDLIEEGKVDWHKIIKDFYYPFEKTLEYAEKEIGEIEIKDEETDIICEKCGRNMVIKHGRFGKFLACPGFPECRNTKPILKETGAFCPKCKGRIIEKKSKKGRIFYGCSNYPECDFMTWDKPTEKKCPICGNNVAERGSGKNKKVYCLKKDCTYEENKKQ
ncbi:type I DNA topoisomerase [Garciella nitratireducens]|uniref:DNA topoisomerase 1 n=1 Tax=Garciella nitratireducens DSM 15102 TaxID=1121911 RepID=A0A1T4JXB6_9FIRM|nr:type I DNA topoisomerase [Garciella nitratireducens]SJZ34801.1 DNA topoisomerase I [Garciella nitratireducens DSM 15102]